MTAVASGSLPDTSTLPFHSKFHAALFSDCRLAKPDPAAPPASALAVLVGSFASSELSTPTYFVKVYVCPALTGKVSCSPVVWGSDELSAAVWATTFPEIPS